MITMKSRISIAARGARFWRRGRGARDSALPPSKEVPHVLQGIGNRLFGRRFYYG